jgi:hypothetical protein
LGTPHGNSGRRMTKTVMGFDERLALAERRISELERKRAS